MASSIPGLDAAYPYANAGVALIYAADSPGQWKRGQLKAGDASL